jgi:dolichol-phosphate mannosyltransferase
MDCDGQHEPRHITEFCDALTRCGTDMVSGSRYLPGSGSAGRVPPDRRVVNTKITEMINEATGWELTDAFCGFKAYRADALRRVRIDETGYAMPLEFWARAWRAGLTLCELPVERIYMDHDRSFGQDLDDPDRRMAYYVAVWERSLAEQIPGDTEGVIDHG